MVALNWSVNIESELGKDNKNGKWFVVGLFFTLFIGFRHEVGGDWFTYLEHFQLMNYYQIGEIFKRSDPGYYTINWILFDWGYDIYAVNTICAAIFMLGLIIFAKRQPNPWLAVAVAIPYLLIVIAMGYTRQAVSLGFVFWGLAALDKKKFSHFIILMVFAATFHKSAVLMIGLGMFLQGKGRAIRFLSIVIVGIGLWSAFLAQYQDQLWKNYVEVKMQSQGAFIRVTMNLIPSLLFILFRKQWKEEFKDFPFWVMIAIGSIASTFFVSYASTAIDRVALYFTPIQVVVYSRLPYMLRNKIPISTTTFLILGYYLLVLFVWLNYASHAHNWLPYQTILFDGIK